MSRLKAVSGRVLIVGGRAPQLAERLTARGFQCETAERVGHLRSVSRPHAVIIAAPAGRLANSVLSAIRKATVLKNVPVLVDESHGPASLPPEQVDSVAASLEELERQLTASLNVRRLRSLDELLRERLELLLDITRSGAQGVGLVRLAQLVALRLTRALACERVAVLKVDGGTVHKAAFIDADGMATPVDLAVSPTLRMAIERRTPVEHEGTWVYPLASEGVAAIQLRRETAFSAEERDFVEAVGLAMGAAAEREGARSAVEQAREALEAAYVDRYRELLDANARLKALDRKKNELLAVLSHDLRAPLNVLLGHAHLLVTDEELKPSARTSSEVIQRTTRKILELIENLLEKSRGQERTVLFTRALDVSETCQDVVKDLQILAKGKGVALRVEAPMSLMVLGDEQKIRQVLQNLITNALKHAQQARQVVVRARLKQRPDGDVALVEVRDDGAVADPNDLLLAFERSRGLGLAICREYVELHGGEIWAEAPPSGGGMFSFTLPIRLEQSAAEHPNRRTDVPLVLIAEDDPVFLRIASMGLSGHYRVESVRDGEQAVERAKALVPDVIVMDVFMPKRDGLEALRELKATAQTRHIPVLLVSSNPELTEKIRTMDVGAVDHLTKPFPLSTLLTRVTEAVQRAHRQVAPAAPGNDGETGLFDHLGIVNRLQQELSRSSRYSRPLTIAVLKPVSPLSNEQVRRGAALVRRELRAPDVVGHLGSGVYVLLLPETAPSDAAPLVGRLCVELEREGSMYRSRVTDIAELGTEADAVLEKVLN